MHMYIGKQFVNKFGLTYALLFAHNMLFAHNIKKLTLQRLQNNHY